MICVHFNPSIAEQMTLNNLIITANKIIVMPNTFNGEKIIDKTPSFA